MKRAAGGRPVCQNRGRGVIASALPVDEERHSARADTIERDLKTKTPRVLSSGRDCVRGCLTMSYFHERMLTIIGAESFHGPVRDGKGWFQLAMVVRHDLSARCPGGGNKPNLVEVGNLEGSM